MRSIVRRSLATALVASLAPGWLNAQQAIPQSLGAADSAAPLRRDAVRKPSGKVLPAVEIAGFLVALNLFDRVAFSSETQNGVKVFSSTPRTTWDHLRQQRWGHDPDGFRVNQFGHPYEGSVMYGLARSTGHGFWGSIIYANIGSFAWEMAGETSQLSIDDLITTSQAGSLFGEAMYRMADLVLKVGGRAKPNRLHEYGAAMISPAGGFNRLLFGDRFTVNLSETEPATSWQFTVGATMDALARDYSSPTTLLRSDASADFSMSYGLPGQPGYDYTRPLDYFDVQLSVLANAKNPVENLMIRGLLIGSKTAETANSHGIWGLYGSYDYISPYLFRVSTTALSLGTTRQHSFTPDVALLGTVMAGVGYGGAGSRTFIPSTPTSEEVRDYHRGITPQALVALQLINGNRAKVSLAAREYYVSGRGSDNALGSETIFRGTAGLTVRVLGGHALGVQYAASTRNAQYGKQANVKLSEGTFTVSYAIIGGSGFKAVR